MIDLNVVGNGRVDNSLWNSNGKGLTMLSVRGIFKDFVAGVEKTDWQVASLFGYWFVRFEDCNNYVFLLLTGKVGLLWIPFEDLTYFRCDIPFLDRFLRAQLGVLSRLKTLRFFNNLMVAWTWHMEKKIKKIKFLWSLFTCFFFWSLFV